MAKLKAATERPPKVGDSLAAIGHNSGEAADPKRATVAVERLRNLVDRIERMEEERKALAGDVRDIYAEAKSAGFDTKVLRKLIAIRKQEPADVEEQEQLLDVYRRAIGM